MQWPPGKKAAFYEICLLIDGHTAETLSAYQPRMKKSFGGLLLYHTQNLDIREESQGAVTRSQRRESSPTLKCEEGHLAAHGALPPMGHIEGFIGLPVATENVVIAFPEKGISVFCAFCSELC